MKDDTDVVTQELPLDDDDLYVVYYKGKPALRLNARLIVQKGLSKDAIENLKMLHRERLTIEEDMEKTDSCKRMKYLFAEWTQNQFDLQKKWGFPEDLRYHRFWELPRCECPRLDNEDAYPTGFYVINQNCPIHGETK
jgi:hypothetical protein